MEEQTVNNIGDTPMRSTSRRPKSTCRSQRDTQRRCRQPRRPRYHGRQVQDVSPEVKTWMDNVIIPTLLKKLRNEVEAKKAA